MDIEDRIRESEQKFEQKKVEREQHLADAEQCLVEMTKLQGEFRVLQELLGSSKKDPSVIVAEPEEDQ